MILYQYISPEVQIIELMTESAFLAFSGIDSPNFEHGEDF